MKWKRRGLALPVLLMVILILVLFAGAVTSLGTSGLTVARKDLDSERAFYAADAGITKAAKRLYMDPGFQGSFAGDLGDGVSYSVTVTRNNTGAKKKIGPVEVPPSTIFIAARGTTQNGVSRESWALFRTGLGSLQVGALADVFEATNSTFEAYDSEAGGGSLEGAAILASNLKTGTTINLVNSTIGGHAFVGQSTTQLVADGTSSVSQVGVLTKAIEVPEIVVPDVPMADGNPTPTPSATPRLWHPDNRSADQVSVAPPSGGASYIKITKDCMTVKIYPDGKYEASEGGSNSYMTGNMFTGENQSNPGGSLRLVSTTPFEIKGNWHRLYIDLENNRFGTDPNGVRSPAPNAATSELTPWVKEFFKPAPALTNPDELAPGAYGNVEIDSVSSQLQENAVYVFKRLNVHGSGQLRLPNGAGNVSIYVTEALTLDGTDTILNETRKPPHLKLYYTGTTPVILSGGAQAYASLLSPFAPVLLKGQESHFYGALIGRSLTVQNATFHYDTATNGVGTGTDGSSLLLLARYRP